MLKDEAILSRFFNLSCQHILISVELCTKIEIKTADILQIKEFYLDNKDLFVVFSKIIIQENT